MLASIIPLFSLTQRTVQTARMTTGGGGGGGPVIDPQERANQEARLRDLEHSMLELMRQGPAGVVDGEGVTTNAGCVSIKCMRTRSISFSRSSLSLGRRSEWVYGWEGAEPQERASQEEPLSDLE